jgi:hypothetical protein
MNIRSASLVVLLPLLVACGDDGGPTAPPLPVTVSGTIQNVNGATIPANARVLVIWEVSSGSPDYAYVWGEGTVHSNGTFSIVFAENPPAAALNNGQLGVGLLVLTTDQNIDEGQLPDTFDAQALLGISEDHAVIFTKNLTGAAAADWPGRFAGYGVGEVERSTTTFDSFRKVGFDQLRIVVDDFEKLNPPNWT